MSKSSRSKKNQESPTKKIDTTVIVAIIGLLGTIIAALLANPALTALVLNSDAPVTPPALETSTHDWQSIIKLVLTNSECEPRQLPSSINPATDLSKAAQQIQAAFDTGEFLNWAEVKDNAEVEFTITNISTGQEKLRVNDTFSVDVALQEYLPDPINVVDASACGGSPPDMLLSPLVIDLSHQVNHYTQQADYSNADLFNIAAGELRRFGLPVQCKASGVYRLNINVAFEYMNALNVTNSNEPLTFACPQTFTLWHYDTFGKQFYSAPETYQWIEDKYERKP